MPGSHRDGKRAGNNFGVEFALVSWRHAVELGAVIGDQAGENVEASGRALRIRLPGNIFRQVQLFDQRNDVDAIFFEDRRASQIDAGHAEVFDFGIDRAVRAGQETGAHAMRHVAEAQVKTRRLDVIGVDCRARR